MSRYMQGNGGWEWFWMIPMMVLWVVVLSAVVYAAVRLYRRADRRSALRLYLYSLAYLALLFCAMVADVHL